MATVRFSERLRSDIRSNARRLFQNKIANAQAVCKQEWGNRVCSVYLKFVRENYGTLNSTFTEFTDQMNFDWIKVGDENIRPGLSSFGVTKMPKPTEALEFNSDMVAATGILRVSPSYRDLTFWVDGDHDNFKTIAQELVARRDAIAALENKQSEFLAGVDAILSAYTTLGPALKKWPPLWDLLDEDVKNRHRQKTERSQTAAEKRLDEQNVDLSKLTAFATAAKMGGN